MSGWSSPTPISPGSSFSAATGFPCRRDRLEQARHYPGRSRMTLQFVITAFDAEHTHELRAKYREEHRARLRASTGAPVKVLTAGPLLNRADEPIGSLIIVEAESHTDVERFVAADPYVVNGVYGSHEIHSFKWTMGAPGPL